jgi:hypothetical protein
MGTFATIFRKLLRIYSKHFLNWPCKSFGILNGNLFTVAMITRVMLSVALVKNFFYNYKSDLLIIEFEVFHIHLWNPRNRKLHKWYNDREALARKQERVQRELSAALYSHRYPDRLRKELKLLK